MMIPIAVLQAFSLQLEFLLHFCKMQVSDGDSYHISAKHQCPMVFLSYLCKRQPKNEPREGHWVKVGLRWWFPSYFCKMSVSNRYFIHASDHACRHIAGRMPSVLATCHEFNAISSQDIPPASDDLKDAKFEAINRPEGEVGAAPVATHRI